MTKIIFKLLRDAFITIKIKYQSNKGLNSISYFKYYFQLFIIRFFFGNTKIRNLIKANKFNEEVWSSIFITPESSKNILKELVNDGCSYVLKLKDDNFEDIKNETLLNMQCPNAIFFDGKNKLLNKQNFFDLPSLENFLVQNNIYMLKNELVINNLLKFKELFTNNFFLNIAQNYFGSKKITVSASIFSTNNSAQNKLSEDSRKALKHKSAQSYHFDVDFKKFFKIIIYFTDVESELDGAHIFIPGTHIKKHSNHYVTDRFSDDDIERSYDRKKTFTGKAGSLFFVDTFGIHKGSTVEKNFRTAVLVEYGKDHFQYSKNAIFI